MNTDLDTQQPAHAAPSAVDPYDWAAFSNLPCEASLEIPVPHFKTADLLSLAPGSIVRTGWHSGEDIPLRVNQTLIAWSEFELIGDNLAVRLTELL